MEEDQHKSDQAPPSVNPKKSSRAQGLLHPGDSRTENKLEKNEPKGKKG